MPTFPLSNNELPGSSQLSLTEHLEFLRLGSAEQQRLRDILELIRPHTLSIVERFYDHLFAFAHTAKHLGDPQLVARLKLAQVSHLESMLAADWNEEYLDQRLHVGNMHAQIGIEPHSFLGAYNLYLHEVFTLLAKRAEAGGQDQLQDIQSLVSAVLLDIGLTLEAYFAQGTSSLRIALDMLWKANNSLRQFAQLTSHDLKTPLATVANLCDEVLDEFGPQLPAGARELIEAAQKRAYRMGTTIDELLATSITLQDDGPPEAITLDKPLQEALERIRPIIEQKRIQITISPVTQRLRVDRVKLREALFNLLSNAAKFVADSGGRIVISCETRGNTCRLSISDNGPGIPRDELERIFVPFRRLPMHRDVPGSGLGLYFTKSLIEQLHGRIWVVSEPGNGATFMIELPFEAHVS
ncbi:MAG: protoglobin domain-containing protein [Pirellulales bacterium]|nr:protoglobin domain-containing protein [Pirellulales bacterium]